MGNKMMLRKFCIASVIIGMSASSFVYAQQQPAKTPLEMQLERLTQAVQQTGQPTIRPQVTPTTPNQQQPQSELASAFNEGGGLEIDVQQPQPEQEVVPEKPPVRDEAFARMSKEALPLTSPQITTLRDIFNQVQRSQASDPRVPPKPTSRSVLIDMSPGATPQVVRMASGYVSALVFTDSTGSPWPIAAYDLGDPRAFNIQWDKKGHILMVQAISMHKRGNVAVLLRGLNTPVMLDLQPGQPAVDYRVDFRIPQLGPNAEIRSASLPGASDPILLDVLNGIAPPHSKRLTSDGFDGDIWYLHGKMYVRTRMTMISPGWRATMSSADGMHAYEIVKTPVILASLHGKVRKLIVKGL